MDSAISRSHRPRVSCCGMRSLLEICLTMCCAASDGFSAMVTFSFQLGSGSSAVFQYSLSGLPHESKCVRWVSGAWMMISMGVLFSNRFSSLVMASGEMSQTPAMMICLSVGMGSICCD